MSVPEGDRREARSERGRGAAARATDVELAIPRVPGRAPQPRVSPERDGELGCERARVDDRTRLDKPLDHRIGLLGDRVLEEERAERRSLARELELVLDGERQSLQRSCSFAAVEIAPLGGSRLFERLVEIRVADGVDRVPVPLDSRDQRFEVLDG